MRIALASDHAGFGLKQFLLAHLIDEPDLEMVDLGVFAAEPPADYPLCARELADAIVRQEFDRGILVCGSGAGVTIAADKVPGARAFFASDTYTAHQAVEHDAANILCLGQRVTGEELALEIARAFLHAQFSNVERHIRRAGEVTAIEASFYYPLAALRRQGQSLWIDYIARSLLASGDLRRMIWDEDVVGMTSNPTIFEKAMGHEKEYEEPARTLAEQGKATEEIYWTLAIEDIQLAADIMRPVYQLTNGGDGYISLEVAPAYATNTQQTIDMTRDLWQRLDRPNVMIKIPATREGVPAVEESIAKGINVNVTLLFAVPLYEDVAHAYQRGLARYFDSPPSQRLSHRDSLVPAPVSVASFFVSRVDTLIDKLLGDKIAAATSDVERSRLQRLLGRGAIANARQAYQRFTNIFSGDAWDALEERGAQVQRPLWASTSTKNPRYRDVQYVEELIGPHTVNTVPPATLEAFKEHGRVSRTVDAPRAVESAEATLRELHEVGIDMAAVTLQLQQEGVKSFADSFDQLLSTLEQRRRTLVGTK